MKSSACGNARRAIFAAVVCVVMVLSAVAVLGASGVDAPQARAALTPSASLLPESANPITIAVGTGPIGVAVDSDNGYVYVANQESVSVISGMTNSVVTTIGIPGASCCSAYLGVAVDSANGYVYVTNRDSSNVTEINGATNTVVGSVQAGDEPTGIAFDSANGDLYIGNLGANNVTVFNGATDTTVTSITVGNGPTSIAFDSTNGYLYVVNQVSGNVTIINGAANTVVRSISLASLPSDAALYGATFDGANGYVYIASYGFVDYIDTLNDKIGQLTVPIDNLPGYDTLPSYALAVDSMNGYVYVTSLIGAVTPLNVSTNTLTTSIPVGIDPVGVAFDGANGDLYVVNEESGNVTVLDGAVYYPTISDFSASPYPGCYTPYPQGCDFVGLPTNLSVNVTSGVGVGALSYAYTGLPPGCSSVDASIFSCTPTHGGSYPVLVMVTDSLGDSTLATALTAGPLLVSAIAVQIGASPPVITIGQSTFINTTVLGGVGPLNYTYTNLPPGCHAANVSSLLCTPTKPSNPYYEYTVLVTDSLGNNYSTSDSLWVQNMTATLWTIPTAVDVGKAVTFFTSVNGGLGPLSYNYTNLPSGCATVNATNLSCSPTSPAVKPYSVTLTVTDSVGNNASATTLLTVNGPPEVKISATPNPADAQMNVAFSATASNGTGPFAYAWLINGTSTAGENTSYAFTSAGDYNVTVYANDSFGLSASATTLVVVYPMLNTTFVVSNSTPLLGQTIALVVNASGGASPYSYSYVGLPPGCVSENKSALGCLPTQSGFYNVTATVSDVNHGVATANVSMQVIFDFNVVVPTNTSAGSPFTISVNTNETFAGGTAIVPAAGFGAFTYNYTGLPTGCGSQDVSSITCTTNQVGTYHITVSVHDQVGDHNTHTVVVNVVPAKSTPGTSGILGLSGDTGYLVIGGVVAFVAAAALLVLLRSRRGKRDKTKPATESSPEPMTTENP